MMADAPKINPTDTLRESYPKLNQAIDNANEALRNSEEALSTANQALANSENTQEQLDQIVIEGDSSVEAAQARVDADGNVFTTLKERLDTKEQQFTAQLAQYWTANFNDVVDPYTLTPEQIYYIAEQHSHPYATLGSIGKDSSG